MGQIIDLLLLIVLCIWYNRHINWIKANYGNKPVLYFIIAVVILCGISMFSGEYIQDKMLIQYGFDALLLVIAIAVEIFRYTKRKGE